MNLSARVMSGRSWKYRSACGGGRQACLRWGRSVRAGVVARLHQRLAAVQRDAGDGEALVYHRGHQLRAEKGASRRGGARGAKLAVLSIPVLSSQDHSASQFCPGMKAPRHDVCSKRGALPELSPGVVYASASDSVLHSTLENMGRGSKFVITEE